MNILEWSKMESDGDLELWNGILQKRKEINIMVNLKMVKLLVRDLCIIIVVKYKKVVLNIKNWMDLEENFIKEINMKVNL